MSVSDYHVHGFDISHWQPAAPDFTQGGRRFGVCKATEGSIDPNFRANRDAMHAQGLAAIGLYHFARPTLDVGEQIDRFVNAVGARRDREFFVLDYEKDPWSQKWAVAFINGVRAALGGPVLFYTYRAELWHADGSVNNAHDEIANAADGLWVAAYSKNVPGTPGWPWLFWQHTNGTNAPDAGSPAWDCSVWHSDEAALAAFVNDTTGDNDMDATQAQQLTECHTMIDQVKKALQIPDDGKTPHSVLLDKILGTVEAHAGGGGAIDYARLREELATQFVKDH